MPPMFMRTGAIPAALTLAKHAFNPVTGNPGFVAMPGARKIGVGHREDRKVGERSPRNPRVNDSLQRVR
ncbi:MAG: hypothetical protein AB7E73_11780 [Burkholderiales bacterium]